MVRKHFNKHDNNRNASRSVIFICIYRHSQRITPVNVKHKNITKNSFAVSVLNKDTPLTQFNWKIFGFLRSYFLSFSIFKASFNQNKWKRVFPKANIGYRKWDEINTLEFWQRNSGFGMNYINKEKPSFIPKDKRRQFKDCSFMSTQNKPSGDEKWMLFIGYVRKYYI